ncbi:MAG: DUF2479 domain-containing protein [Alphaproteobacteria bacterium]|nr:DUF2479 domain-containing protein [Alphaproteobacteria bacterium]
MSGRIIAQTNLIEVRQGDSFTINIQIKKGHKPLDLNGSKLMMQVRDTDDTVMISKVADFIDSEQGKMSLILTSTDTDVSVGDYKVDIQLILPDNSIHTIFPSDVNKIGIFRITEQVTR